MPPRSQRYWLILLLVFFYRPLPAQHSFHVQLLEHNQLASPMQIQNILRDDRGFLWLLHPTTVQRFDGKNFKTFSIDDRCLGIQQDAQGTIWLLTRQHIYRFTNDHKGFAEVPGTRASFSKYRRLLAAADGQLYLLTANSLEKWDGQQEKFKTLGLPPFSAGASFNVLESYGHHLFFRNDNYLFRYHLTTKKTDSVRLDFPNYVIPINADSVFVRRNIGATCLVSFSSKTVVPLNTSQFGQEFANNTFFITGGTRVDKENLFVLIQHKGCFIYSTSTNQFRPVRLYFKGRPLTGYASINGFHAEEDGTIWFPFETGLVSFHPQKEVLKLLRSHISNSPVEWNNEIRNFSEDKNGDIWFATTNGFCKWNKKTDQVTVWIPRQGASDYLNYPSIRSIGCAGDQVIVGQSEGGFWIFDTRTGRFGRPHFTSEASRIKFESDFNSNMLRLQDGSFLIISRALYLLEPQTQLVREISFPGANNRYRTAFQDAQGRIWLMGTQGITVVDRSFHVLYSLKDSVLGRWVNSLVQLDKNTFWATAKTLFEIRIKNGGLAPRPIFPELKQNHFSGLFKDSLGRVWICDARGIYRYVPERGLLEKFDENDNAQHFNVSFTNSYRASDGTVYLGSLNGINYFVPEKIPLQQQTLKLHLLNVSVNNDDSSFLIHGRLPQLRHHQNLLVFDFIAPYFFNAEKLQYRYQLKGAGADWVYIGNNTSVRFSLSPGDYHFVVAASVNGKDWFELEQPFAFSIQPPFWMKWWFLALLVLTVVAVARYLVKRRIRLVKEREAQKIELEKLKAANYQYRLEIEQIINYFTTSISEKRTVDEILWDVARNCISKLGFEDCVIYLLDQERQVLVQKAAWGPKTVSENLILHPIEIPVGKGIVGSVAASGVAEIINDTSTDDRYIVDDERRLSEITVPIFENGRVIGVIDSEHSERNFYTQKHLQILATIASHCGVCIGKIRAEAKTESARMEALLSRQKALEASLQSMRLQMNPHFLFNALNSIQQMILAGEETTATRFLSKFSRLLRLVLTSSDKEEVSLKDELEILHLYVELESLRFKETFSFAIHCDQQVDLEETQVPALLFQPLVENAIWHGLMHKEGERRLQIFFNEGSEGALLCAIEDNGIGRAASAVNGHLKNHTGKGLALAKTRLQVLNEKNGTKSRLEIIDKTDPLGKPCGTRVEIVLFPGLN